MSTALTPWCGDRGCVQMMKCIVIDGLTGRSVTMCHGTGHINEDPPTTSMEATMYMHMYVHVCALLKMHYVDSCSLMFISLQLS